MSQKRMQIIQLLLEAGLPILGFLFWKWNLAFILFYYVFDWFASTLLTGVKIKKCIDYLGGGFFRSNWYLRIFVSIALIFPSLLLSFFFLKNLNPEFSVWGEFDRFFFYKDMGIEQGYLLVPLVLLNAWTQYKMQFLTTRLYTRTSEISFSNTFLLQNAFILGGIVLCYVSSFFFQLNEWVYIGFLLISCSAYRFFLRV